MHQSPAIARFYSLFLHEDRITPALRSHLPNVQLLPYNAVSDVMHKLSSASPDTRFWLPSGTTSKALASLPALENRTDRRLANASPIALLKAVKNAVEMRGMRDAHVSPRSFAYASMCGFGDS